MRYWERKKARPTYSGVLTPAPNGFDAEQDRRDEAVEISDLYLTGALRRGQLANG